MISIQEWSLTDAGELVDGLSVEDEMTTFEHDAIAFWLASFFRDWIQDAGIVTVETKLAITPIRGRKPDILVFLRPHLPLRGDRVSKVAPRIAVEILSALPRDRIRDRVDKHREYADFGIQYYWIVEPELRIVTIYELNGQRYTVLLTAVTGQHAFETTLLDLDALWAYIDSIPAA